jgi:hypothetical protein
MAGRQKMRIVYEVSEKRREGKRIEQAQKLERRKARRAKEGFRNVCAVGQFREGYAS